MYQVISVRVLRTDRSWYVSEHPNRAWKSNPEGTSWHAATVEAGYGSGPWGTAVHPWTDYSSYLFHLYFQPERVAVLRDPDAFSSLSTVVGILTAKDAAALRPDYQGSSELMPSRVIDLLVHADRSPAKVLHSKSVMNQPILVTAPGSKAPELLLDFGQEVTGRIQVRGTGGTVLIGTGESRGEALHCPWGGVHLLPLKAGEVESTPYSAFRYATVQFYGQGTIRLNRLRLDFKYYPVKYRGAFACSDPLLTQIWYTGAYTAHLCMQKQIWDGPKRDRGLWMGDMQVTGRSINYAFLDRYLMELSLRLVRLESQGGKAANATPTGYVNGLPGYSNAWFCALYDFYLHSGDMTFIRSQHQLLLSMLRYVKQGFNKNNIFVNKHKFYLNFVDWAKYLVSASPHQTSQVSTATDLFTCWAVQRAVYLLNAMGDTANAKKYADWERQLIAAARRYLASPKTDTYTNLRQVNAMAIDSHVADARQRNAIYSRILGPDCTSWKQIATPYYNDFVIMALAHLGHYRQAVNFIRYYWGGMIHEGATTFWEKYDPTWPKKHFHLFLNNSGRGDAKGAAVNYYISLCHGWASGPASWLPAHVLGVQPQSGGFAKTTIIPHLGSLKWATGRVPTPRGNIVLRVTRAGVSESIDLTLPAGINALVGVAGDLVTVNGSKAEAVRRNRTRCYIDINKAGTYIIEGRK